MLTKADLVAMLVLSTMLLPPSKATNWLQTVPLQLKSDVAVVLLQHRAAAIAWKFVWGGNNSLSIYTYSISDLSRQDEKLSATSGKL